MYDSSTRPNDLNLGGALTLILDQDTHMNGELASVSASDPTTRLRIESFTEVAPAPSLLARIGTGGLMLAPRRKWS